MELLYDNFPDTQTIKIHKRTKTIKKFIRHLFNQRVSWRRRAKESKNRIKRTFSKMPYRKNLYYLLWSNYNL